MAFIKLCLQGENTSFISPAFFSWIDTKVSWNLNLKYASYPVDLRLLKSISYVKDTVIIFKINTIFLKSNSDHWFSKFINNIRLTDIQCLMRRREKRQFMYRIERTYQKKKIIIYIDLWQWQDKETKTTYYWR